MSSTTINPYNWKYALISQVYLVALSFVLTYRPQYFIEVVALYFVFFTGLTFYMMSKSNPLLRDRKLLYEISSSRVLYEEKNVSDIINKDKEYVEEYTKFAKRSFSMLGIYLVYLVAIYFLYSNVTKIADAQVALYRLLVYLVYFEALYLFAFFVFRRIVRPASLSVMAPVSYKITEKGIMSSGGMSMFLHAKHLLNSNIVVNKEKRFVEIDSTQAKMPYKVRLYSNDVDKVLDFIERVKKLELKKQSSSQQ
ncbi:MAG: hypothetical protein ASUL_01630 [Candidatus Aramenus sulfurataquae]|jgi:uncharacterized membrane protein|uniref:DUF2208 domain-containing protein n=3 Tax=Candidatus Aramenus sulfurataquae TaxID=1326980 RepID=W7KQA6_9CREN|nr:MAG: hypothetical protein ASUL_01630 [Candidatus Aramenus sulfurataquae]MCL7343473.1 DUF2208 domain-containing protein [Candidatus Aramenus sulfurataquae]